MAEWYDQWELINTLRLQALEQGHPYPPLTLPRLDLQLHLPEGVPEDLPPSFDRCAACQSRLEEVGARACVRACGAGASCWGGCSRGFGASSAGRQQRALCAQWRQLANAPAAKCRRWCVASIPRRPYPNKLPGTTTP